MSALSSANDDFEASSTQMLEALQQQRTDLLGAAIDIHVGIGLLAGVEAGRLAQKYGEADARVQLLRDRRDAAAARVDALSVEQEIATVRTPPPPSGAGALIQGRVTDMTQRAAGQVIVQLIDEKGQPVAGFEPVETDAAGYFAFELTPETVKATQSKLSVLLRDADVQLVPVAAQPIAIAPGATLVMDVPLSAAELERLRLRMAVAADTVTVKAPTTDVSTADKTAADKAAADKAAADKAAAAKAAADKAAADEAAADKAAADKAAAEKAAAGKAAADKAAADKAAADWAAADKAAADKAAAAKATADKAAADKSANKTAKSPPKGGAGGSKT